MDLGSQNLRSLHEKWGQKSGGASQQRQSADPRQHTSLAEEEQPERPGVGAKVSAKARRKREDRERLQSVLAKNVKFSKRKDSLKAAQKGFKKFQQVPAAAAAAAAGATTASEDSESEEESRTTLTPAKKKIKK